MRILVFSLIDDWDLGQRLKQRGHDIIGWVRPVWEERSTSGLLPQSIKIIVKKILSQTKPVSSIKARYDTSRWLIESNIPRITCTDVHAPSFIAFLKSQQIDLILTGVYPQIFKAPVLQIPRLGAINYHPSLLPQYAGPQPTFWMIRNGEKMAGITVHTMTEKVDAGDILAQQSFDIGQEENAGQLLQRQHHSAAELLVQTADALAQERAQPFPQNLFARSYFGRRKANETFVNWKISAIDLFNLLRALQPFEPLRSVIKKKRIRIFQIHVVNSQNREGEIGQVIHKNGSHFVVQTGMGCLNVSGYEIEPFHGWINKMMQFFIPQVGDRFDPPSDANTLL